MTTPDDMRGAQVKDPYGHLWNMYEILDETDVRGPIANSESNKSGKNIQGETSGQID